MAPKRNDPCHCGSSKKYKHCHMKADRDAELAAREALAENMRGWRENAGI